MRTKLYKYSGGVSQISGQVNRYGKHSIDMIVYDIRDNDKAPTRLTCYGDLAEYINELECCDDEERYLTWDYYYSGLLDLAFVVIPSTDERRPSKVLVRSDWDGGMTVFGAKEHINTTKPEPMSWEEYAAAREWICDRYELPGRF